MATLNYSSYKLNQQLQEEYKRKFKEVERETITRKLPDCSFKNSRKIVIVKQVKNLTEKDLSSVTRAGVIVYRVIDIINGVHLLLGVDRKHKELTDFGGGVSKKKDKNPIETALREFNEETLGIFGQLTIKDIKDSLAFINQQMMVIMIHMPVNLEKTVKTFEKNLVKHTEISDLVWISLQELEDIINNKSVYIMYERLKLFLTNVGENLTRLL